MVHWIDEDIEVQEVLIALPDLKGDHSGASITEVAFKVIEAYGIGSKVSFYMLDNATNNDTAVLDLALLLVEKYSNHVGLCRNTIECVYATTNSF